MKRDLMLGRLLEMRRRSEQRAGDVLVRRNGARRQIEAQAMDAGRRVSMHMAQARDRERDMLDKLLGRPVALSTIDRFLAGVESLQQETKRLRANENTAKAALHRATAEHEAARADYHRRRRATAKLESIVQQHDATVRRRDLALGELAEEDHRWSAAAPSVDSARR
jgi:hypothetical protein